jgi:hypothetical protein
MKNHYITSKTYKKVDFGVCTFIISTKCDVKLLRVAVRGTEGQELKYSIIKTSHIASKEADI